MAFRRSGQIDQRRRRVLLDENLAGKSGGERTHSARTADGNRNQRTYTDAALAANQPPVTALIPQRFYTLATVLLALLCVVAAPLAAYSHFFLSCNGPSPWRLAAFDLAATGSLAAWFGSLFLLAAAVQSIQVYRLRRHRVDDYRGRYRMWLWMPALFALLAVGVSTTLAEEAATLVARLLGLGPGPALTHLLGTLFCALWSLISLRLAFEIRRCRTALLFLAISVACYFAPLALQAWPVPPHAALLGVLASAAALLIGHWAVLAAVTAFARHVYLDAQGLLGQCAAVRRPTKLRAARKAKAESPAKEPVSEEPVADADEAADESRADVLSIASAGNGPPADKPAATMPRVTAPPTITAATPKPPVKTLGRSTPEDDGSDEGGDSVADPDDDGELSRAERRRLRKLQRREHRRAA